MTEKEKESKKRGGAGLWALIIVGCLVVLAICAYFFYQSEEYAYTNDANIDAYVIAVSPDILARIITLEVEEGDTVTQGQLLCVLDESIPLAEKQTMQAKVASLEASVRLKEILLQKIKDDYERGEKGIKDQVITSQQFDHLQKDYEAAIAELDLEKKNLQLAIASVDEIDARLLHTKIWAPCNGVIAQRWGWVGNVLSPGQAIFSLYDLDNVWVTINLQENDFAGVKIGSPVEISIDAYPDVKFSGEIIVIKGACASQFSLLPQDNATGNYTKVAQRIPLYASIHPPEEQKNHHYFLFPGMSAEVKIKVR